MTIDNDLFNQNKFFVGGFYSNQIWEWMEKKYWMRYWKKKKNYEMSHNCHDDEDDDDEITTRELNNLNKGVDYYWGCDVNGVNMVLLDEYICVRSIHFKKI